MISPAARRATDQRGMGAMPTIQYQRGVSVDKKQWPSSKEFDAELIAIIGKEPSCQPNAHGIRRPHGPAARHHRVHRVRAGGEARGAVSTLRSPKNE